MKNKLTNFLQGKRKQQVEQSEKFIIVAYWGIVIMILISLIRNIYIWTIQ